jgi:hypothetical protein
MAKKSATNDLLPPDPEQWTVITVTHKKRPMDEVHKLRFGLKVEMMKRGAGGLRNLREMADFLNSRNLAPRPKIQCLADR